MILADIHMLGPFRGHWADKLWREWHMHRAFQTAIQLHRPDVIFILGDLFDEGLMVGDHDFDEYVQRFRRLFYVPDGIRLYGALGNHDVGFHYRMRSELLRRFWRQSVYANPANGLITVGSVNFVVVNSMAMEADGCTLCRSAEATLRRVGTKLNCWRPGEHQASELCRNVTGSATNDNATAAKTYSAPVLLQHFPTWRASDKQCSERDAELPLEKYRERWEVLSERSTRWLADVLEPRLVFSGHSHRYCRTTTVWGVDEWTVNSFNWRNNINPVFVLASLTRAQHAVNVCPMPVQTTVTALYVLGAVSAALALLVQCCCRRRMRRGRNCWLFGGILFVLLCVEEVMRRNLWQML